MPTLLTNSIPDSQKSDVDRLNARLFAQFHRAYAEASDDVQEIIHEMVQIINDPAADENEKNAAADTLLEALFPSNHQGTLGIDIEALHDVQSQEVKDECIAPLDQEEESFADRLASLMEAKGITQTDLAKTTGVQQPAVSMMLNRGCRPQRRTVKKIADALGVEPHELWPNYSD